MIRSSVISLLTVLMLQCAFAELESIELLKANASEGPIRVEFNEIRHFQLKKRDFYFSGTMRFHPELGMSIEYNAPSQKIFVLSNDNLIIREEGEPDKTAPEQAIPIVRVFLNLMALDEQALLESFEPDEKMGPNSQWTLTLFPKLPELKRAMQWIEVEGDGADIKSIRVQNGSRRWRILSFEHRPEPWTPTEQELSKYF